MKSKRFAWRAGAQSSSGTGCWGDSVSLEVSPAISHPPTAGGARTEGCWCPQPARVVPGALGLLHLMSTKAKVLPPPHPVWVCEPRAKESELCSSQRL